MKFFIIKRTPLILIFLISGCAVGTLNTDISTMELPKSYDTAYSGPEGEVAFSGQWWRAFNDAQLNALMGKTFGGNLDLLQGVERVRQARLTARVAGAALGPALNLSGSAGRARQPSPFGVTTTDSYRLSAAASYEIDFWKRLGSARSAARLDALAAREDMKALYITISAEVAELYFLAMEQRAQLALTEENITAFAETASRLEERYRAGLVGPLDVYRSRENLSAARARLPLFRQRLEKTEHALSVLIGQAPGSWSFTGRSELPEPPSFPAGLPSELLRRRPDIKAAMLRLASSDKRVQAAIADRFPSFNLVGDYGGASTNLKSILDSPNIFWNLAVQAALPVLDGGRRKVLSERAESERDEFFLRYRAVVLNSLKEVEDALSSSAAGVERVKRLSERTVAAGAALDLAKDRYFHGIDDYLPVLDAQRSYFNSSSELTGARRELISSTSAEMVI